MHIYVQITCVRAEQCKNEINMFNLHTCPRAEIKETKRKHCDRKYQSTKLKIPRKSFHKPVAGLIAARVLKSLDSPDRL